MIFLLLLLLLAGHVLVSYVSVFFKVVVHCLYNVTLQLRLVSCDTVALRCNPKCIIEQICCSSHVRRFIGSITVITDLLCLAQAWCSVYDIIVSEGHSLTNSNRVVQVPGISASARLTRMGDVWTDYTVTISS